MEATRRVTGALAAFAESNLVFSGCAAGEDLSRMETISWRVTFRTLKWNIIACLIAEAEAAAGTTLYPVFISICSRTGQVQR